jgi:RNA polymerase sigma factor (sigma-70 family)
LRQETFAVVRRYFAGSFDQEEAFQEAWLQICRARTAFDVTRADELGAWACTVTRNRCLDLLRERGRRPRLAATASLDEAEGVLGKELAGGEVVADGARLRELLRGFVDRLDAEEGAVFRACFVEGLGHPETARAVGISSRRSKYVKKKLLARLLASAELAELAAAIAGE